MSDSVQKYSASRMGSAPIGPLLLSCSVPMMISMLVQALYNIVDSIFVSQMGKDALTAVSLATNLLRVSKTSTFYAGIFFVTS